MSNPRQGTIGPLTVRDAPGPGQVIRGYLDFVANVNVADPVGMTDNNTSLLSIDANGRLRVIATVAPGTTFPTLPAVTVDSLGDTGRVVGPAAGGAIVTVAAPPAGTYEVEVTTYYDGVPALAAEANNMELREGAVVRSDLIAPGVANVIGPIRTFILVLDGATAVSVNAVGAATAGVGYNAELVLRRVA